MFQRPVILDGHLRVQRLIERTSRKSYTLLILLIWVGVAYYNNLPAKWCPVVLDNGTWDSPRSFALSVDGKVDRDRFSSCPDAKELH